MKYMLKIKCGKYIFGEQYHPIGYTNYKTAIEFSNIEEVLEYIKLNEEDTIEHCKYVIELL
jgi:hypothetical protein